MFENITRNGQKFSVRKREIELDREEEEGPYIYEIVYLGDGLIAGGIYDDCLKIWDSQTGGVEYVIEELYNDVKSVCLHSKGLLCGLFNGVVFVFDSKPPFRPKYPTNFIGHELGVTCLVEIDLNRFASGSNDKKIRIWRIDNGDCLQILRNHRTGISSILYVNNLDILCSCAGITYERGVVDESEYRIILWDKDTGSVIKKLPKVHTKSPTSLTYFEKKSILKHGGNCKKILVSAGSDGRIVFYDLLSGECMFSIQETSHYGIKSLLLFDSNFIISGHVDGTIIFWDIWRQRKEMVVEDDEQLDCINSMIWLEEDKEILGSSKTCGKRVLVSASDDKSVYLYDVTNLSKRMKHKDELEREEFLRKICHKWMTVKIRLKKKNYNDGSNSGIFLVLFSFQFVFSEFEWDRLRAFWMNAIVLRLESAELEIRKLRKENQFLRSKVLELEMKNDK